MSFEIGQTYKDNDGNSYTLLSKDNDFGLFKFNRITKKFKIISYCGIDAVVQYGKILFKSQKIVPIPDDEFDKPKTNQVVKLNNNNQRYINVFRRNKEILPS